MRSFVQVAAAMVMIGLVDWAILWVVRQAVKYTQRLFFKLRA